MRRGDKRLGVRKGGGHVDSDLPAGNLTDLPTPSGGGWKQGGDASGCCDLKREAAHNLGLIYKESGAIGLAQKLYREFLTI